MRQIFLVIFCALSSISFSQLAQTGKADGGNSLPVRGFCIGAPQTGDLVRFIKFIDEELAPRRVNVLVLMVDYNYQYESHPELRDSATLSKNDIKKLLAVCKKNNIRLIPQINLLGHQSWAGKIGNLLKAYPQFDETPLIKMPEKYVWPNSDGLYCKSYCPLNPDLHAVVFDIVDEICNVFETDSFHAGMDEVFYIGESQCPRCSGRDKAELFAGEVRTIRDHLALKNRMLWIWGDRLLDGKTTGLGEWEASYNNTYRAIDMIPKDVIICDWHYERPDQTSVYLAMKGLSVITCPWNNASSAVLQTQDMVKFRKSATPEMKERFMGMMQTIWSGAGQFLDNFYGIKPERGGNSQVNCFKAMFTEIQNLSDPK
jgi:N-acetyl-beta-hexosaminidase